VIAAAEGLPLAAHDELGDASYLTAAQLAALIQVDKATVYRWAAAEPSMPTLRIGSVVRFPREQVLAWLAAHTQGFAKPRRKAAAGSTTDL